MTKIPQPPRHVDPGRVVGGVDTHKDQHVAATLDHVGRVLGVEAFPATGPGFDDLHRWLESHGEIEAVGMGAAARGVRAYAGTCSNTTSQSSK